MAYLGFDAGEMCSDDLSEGPRSSFFYPIAYITGNLYEFVDSSCRHRRSQGCSGCTCTPQGGEKNL